MSLNSTKGIFFPSDRGSILDRVHPQAQNTSLLEIQSEVDQLVGNALAIVSDEKMMASLFGAGLAGRFVRLGTTAASGRSLAPFIVQGASHATALAGESAVFASMERGFAHMEGHAVTQPFQKAWTSAAINLGSIKLFGGAARAQNLITQHLLIDAGMVGSHHAGYALGVTDKPHGNLALQMVQAEGMNLGMKGSLALLHGFLPRFSALERSMEVALRSRSLGLFSQNPTVPFLSPMQRMAMEGVVFTSSARPEEWKGPTLMMASQGNEGEGKGGAAETSGVERGHPVQAPSGKILIPAGQFRMGAEDLSAARPVRDVYVSSFHIDPYLVTNEQFLDYVGRHQREPFALFVRDMNTGLTRVIERGSDPAKLEKLIREIQSGEGLFSYFEVQRVVPQNFMPPPSFDHPKQPVVLVNWYEALGYAAAQGGRLPTEAEWEKAARGPKALDFGTSTGELNVQLANTDWHRGGTVQVGSYPPNGYGLYDMAGNASEWTMDGGQDSYRGLSDRDPVRPGGKEKILRGGSFDTDFRPQGFRTAYREPLDSLRRREGVGFRTVVPF